jgi:Arabinose-binding domain of AraC transcription regulator, N-term
MGGERTFRARARGSLASRANGPRLNEEQLRDPDARVPRSGIVRLWRAVASRVPDSAFGLRYGAEFRLRDFGLVGYTMAFSRTVGAALERLARYDRILSETLAVTLDARDDATWLRVDVEPELRAFRPAADFRLAALLAGCREIAAAPLVLLTVQLPYRRPADVHEYERFYRAPLEFGALGTAFLLRSDDLARPVRVSDDTLTGYLDRLAEQTRRRPCLERGSSWGAWSTSAKASARHPIWSRCQ